MRSTLDSSASAARTARSARSQASTTPGTAAASAFPGPVKAMPALERSNSLAPSRSSNCRICLVSAGWET
jgi:hypothetical protein